jgi:diaminopimelate decarboxylase
MRTWSPAGGATDPRADPCKRGLYEEPVLGTRARPPPRGRGELPATLGIDDTRCGRTCLCPFRAGSPHGSGRHTVRVLDLFPETAAIEEGELLLGGVRATALASEFGTPLVVYCEQTMLERAREYQAIDPEALIVYGTKAFANVALLRLFAREGLGADVSTLGELRFALDAGVPSDRIVFHGNNKSDEELRAAANAGTIVVIDAPDEVERAVEAGVERLLVRLTPGVEAETHESIQTAHSQSKFGLDPDQAYAAVATARDHVDVLGVHVHIGSQLARVDESLAAVDRLVEFCARCRDELGWRPQVVDLGGGLGVRHSRDERIPSVADFAGMLVTRFRRQWKEPARVFLEPGRSLIGRAGVTLYRVGATKRSGGIDYVAIDGGMSDNPRPQLYGARYEALLANRADEPEDGVFRIAGKHCESGDVLIDRATLPHPRRGDVLAVPATGAYTLAMASTYNGVPRPAAVLVADGNARLIRRRETIDDLIAYEAG